MSQSDGEEKIPPRIEVSHFTVHKVRPISEENLIKGNDELPGGVCNPVFNVEEPSSGVVTPEGENFLFDNETIQRYKSQPRRGTFAGGTNPSSRMLLSDRRNSENEDILNTAFLMPGK